MECGRAVRVPREIMKRIITIDIETLPINAPIESNLFWENEEGFRKTSLDGALGRILCIGFYEKNEFGENISHGCFGWNEVTQTFETDEAKFLQDFWDFMSNFNLKNDLIIGHNILSFDLPFIVKRSRVLGVAETVNFDFYKYQKYPIYDTMLHWDCWVYKKEGSTSLHKLAYAFGLTSPKEELDGSKVYDAFLAGEFLKLKNYCMDDVRTTHQVWQFITKRITPSKSMALAS
jgi:3'-5' exonuclease